MALVTLPSSQSRGGPAMASSAQRPRRHTPDHPPYAMMIGEAIGSLGEKGGSTEAAISQYIKAHYDDLPWGHDRLLPYYLKKLTLSKEFTLVGPGRYLVAEDAESLPVLSVMQDGGFTKPAESPKGGGGGSVSVQQRRGRPSRKKVIEDQSEIGNDGGVAWPVLSRRTRSDSDSLLHAKPTAVKANPSMDMVAKDGATTESVQAASSPVSSRTRVSSVSKKPMASVDALLLPTPATMDCDPSKTIAPSGAEHSCQPKDNGDGSAQAPKRRGRPPKNKLNPPEGSNSGLDSKKTGKDKPIINVNPSLQMEPASTESESGRDFSSPSILSEAMNIDAKDVMATSLPPPKRGGRPPKRKLNSGDDLEVKLKSKQTTEDNIEIGSCFDVAMPAASRITRRSSASKPIGKGQPLLSIDDGSSSNPTFEKDGTAGASEYLLALLHPMPKETTNKEDSPLLQKRRGRPPKNKPDLIEPTVDKDGATGAPEYLLPLPHPMPRENKNKEDSSLSQSLPPKHRGRPPKNKLEFIEPTVENDGAAGALEYLLAVPHPMPRENKDKEDSSLSQSPPPKCCGRPPKNKLEFIEPTVENDGAAGAPEYLLVFPHPLPRENKDKEDSSLSRSPPPKRRGRPPKNKLEFIEPTVENDGAAGAPEYLLALPHPLPKEYKNKEDSSLPPPRPLPKHHRRLPKSKPALIEPSTEGTGDQGKDDAEPAKGHDVPDSIPMSVDKEEDGFSVLKRRGRLPK